METGVVHIGQDSIERHREREAGNIWNIDKGLL